MALTEAAKEVIWLKGLASDLGLQQKSMIVKCDSKVLFILRKFKYFMQGQNILKSAITGFEIGSIPKKFR